MLYLVTGMPGSGKTSHVVSMLMKQEQWQNRPLFIDGIDELDPAAVPHESLPENCNGANWHEWLPNGAILVIDECQRYWRKRPNGSKVPPAVQELETHRHRGVDIILITQKANLIDDNIKAFIFNHKHFDISPLGTRRMIEWNGFGNVDSKSDIAKANIKMHSVDADTFGKYKSAEIHTQTKVVRNKQIYLAAALIIGALSSFGFALYQLFGKDNPFMDSQPKTTKAEQVATTKPTQATEPNSGSLKPPTGKELSKGIYPVEEPKPKIASEPEKNDNLKADDFKPAIKGQPWTAPIYNGLNRQIKSMPYPDACLMDNKGCRCYTKQGTLMADLDKQICLDRMAGKHFNPYQETESQPSGLPSGVQQTAPSSYSDVPQVQTLDSKAKEPNLLYDDRVELGFQ